MLISVIMPAYNAGSYISQAIQSILDQTYPNFELLIADDNSLDNTNEIIESYDDPRIKTYHNDVNLGYLKTCNKLLEKCTGDFITFQDADDWSDLRRLELLLGEFNKDSELGVCGSQYKKVDDKGVCLFVSKYPFDYRTIREIIPNQYLFLPGSVMLKREVYESFGGYHEYFDRCGYEDVYWLFKIILNYKIININQALYYYRFNPYSITKSFSVQNIKQLYIQQITSFLIRQILDKGTNILEEGGNEEMKILEEKFMTPYLNDPSKAYREFAASHMYWKRYKLALSSSWRAIKVSPFKILNYRTLLYCFRKALLNK
ncbi:glycosyltransferase family 2 protein [Xanthovirga aplysinae]|uniref:glycosyltransferase family 2 protein n=1 Tax=Xanthovirga aplysinae TaxID=2529853 RepID=UPI0012BD1797|nr:glycosyltransferase family A protein [Xanthovirga aplysinae]MTI32487.1 glycosyltransferase family 2 protein [Xanthovirga aplysinae]